jgi:hypothetical protein
MDGPLTLTLFTLIRLLAPLALTVLIGTLVDRLLSSPAIR